ncbi:hypothetical protein DNU06_00520 [Putridiphycobacter roseus]|uniref:Signal transduction histidine kinase internal region domain-containing protein n=1 Tax=Putridiphycobacter roseus TaxID=2219161 RepID=A0A2W1NRT6_9FLAO|nr:histidine kinase [Putridiphycobacter roseus]PZE18352.1 hypothetical protein DNU06_00520 [Putridiphycobacter roseus]
MSLSFKNNNLYWVAQFIGWGVYILITFALSYLSGGILITQKLIIYYFVSVLLSVLAAHSLRFFIIKFNWIEKAIWKIILYSIIGSVLASTAFEVAQIVYNKFISEPDYYDYEVDYFGAQLSINIFITFIVTALWCGIYYSYLFIEKSRQQEIKNLQYEASKNEIELKNLRAQINPHFLFNSLNSIKALVEIDKEESKKAITKLSNLLRNSIMLTRHKLITLEKELELVVTYLDIEKIRFEDHIRVKLYIDPASLEFKIPPLTIQTIAENAIKHGLSKLEEGGDLIIKTEVNADILMVTISNTGQMNPGNSNHGIGIENTRKRLAIIFGDEAHFDLFEKEGKVHAYIAVKKITDENED